MSDSKKTVFISGGASGLGEATARRFSADGWHVAIADMQGDKARELASELGDAAVFELDISDPAAVEEAMVGLKNDGYEIRAAVSCAGIGTPQRIISKRGAHDPGDFLKIIHVNLVGTFNVIRAASIVMVDNEPDENEMRGMIVNTASVAAYEGQIGQIAYSASKGGVVGMTLPAARDLADKGIRVNTIAPGLFLTPLLESLPDEAKQSLAASVPNPSRLGDPAEYADLVAFIRDNVMMNGETIRIDGAIRMAPR